MIEHNEKNIFEQMSEEHQIISKMVLVFDKTLDLILKDTKSFPAEDIEKTLIFFKDFVDEYHHSKEELILFPAADQQNVVVRQGGPKCTFFFGMYLDEETLANTLEDVKSYHKKVAPYSANTPVQTLLDKNSPLSIPLSEHETGYYSMQLLKSELLEYKQNTDKDMRFFVKVASRYSGMLKKHIQKEDECLFVTLQKTFPESLVDKLNTEFNNFNTTKKQSQLNCMSIYNELTNKYL